MLKKQVPPVERVLALLKRRNARLKFKHIVKQTGLSHRVVNAAIAEIRETHPNLTFAKFDRTFYFADTPTWYSQHTDLSRRMPLEGEFGVVSDTHLCSVAERLDILRGAYREFERRGIRTVLHAGDVTDGSNSYRGHHNFVKVMGSQEQALYVIRHYPHVEGLTTYCIEGNHDLDNYDRDKVDRLSLVVNGFWHEGRQYEGRKDIVFCGQYSHNFIFPQEVVVHVLHPRSGIVYAISYKQQKRSEAMDRNLRPDLQISGHMHTFNFCWLGGTFFYAAPGLQDETEFFKRLGLPRNVGYAVLRYRIKDGKFAYLAPDVFMFS